MLRKAAVLTLIAAFVSAATPGFACTGISLKAQDGAAIRGRTLEFGFPMQSNVLVIPAGKEMSGTLPDGGKGLVYTSRYAIVGANALGLPAILDGLNDDIPNQNSAIGGTVDEITEWTSVADLKNLRWYFRTFTDQSIHVVDLKEAVEAAKGKVRILKMEGTSQPIADASTNFVAGK